MNWLSSNGKWLGGYIALWAILVGMVDLGYGDIAAALGLTIAGTLYLTQGTKIFANINGLVGA